MCPVKIICYCVIISVAKLQFSACISLTQEEHNIIVSRPMKLVCNIGTKITNTVTVSTPDGVAVVSCSPTSVVPPIAAVCVKSGDYTGLIDETANTVTVTTNILLSDVNGTWSCTHDSAVATIVFPTPIPCLISENFDVNPSSTGNITSTTATFSLIATYSCINVDVTFKWILTAGGTQSKEFISSSVTRDSASCTDSGTCTGVSAYTQTISSDSLFIFAKTENLIGGYELSAEAVLSNGVTALKSHSIGYFEFSQSTDSCDCDYWICIGIILAFVSPSSFVCTVVIIWKRKQIELRAKKTIRCSEKLRWKCCGTSTYIVLHLAVLLILMITTLVIWLITMLIVIFLCCAGKECEVKGTVIGISFVLSLVVILILSVFFWIICCCADREYRRVEVECGNRITLLDDFKLDGKIASVEWIHEGNIIGPSENIAGGTKAIPPLTLQMVSLNQSGKYVCTIKYATEGEKDKDFRLNLIVLQQPTQQVNSCERVVLLTELKKSTTTLTSVVWTHDRNQVPINNFIYKGGTTDRPALTILNVSTDDSGIYECKLTFAQGHIRKYRSILKVIEQPPQKVNACERVVLLKKLKGSTTVTSVVWTRDRQHVSTTNCFYEGGTTETPALTILVVSTDDSGMYECKLTLAQGYIRKYRIKLEVNEKPIQNVNSGERVVLLDKLDSLNGVTSVAWTHDGKPVTQNNCFFDDWNTGNPVLTIPIVSPEMSGKYKCEITLNQGLIRKYGVMLKVNVPKIKKRVGEKVRLLNDLRCPTEINLVKWYINGSQVEAQTDDGKYQGGLRDSPSLLVGSLERSDSGRYRCDLIISDLQIILQIPVDLEVELDENSSTLPPLRIPNRVYPTIQS